ncbi:mechanosensitive ion channel family protein [Methyloceanibacter sp. wino2]|uniref:mechanosensitive ion channel family protein n=1 Tax=Methyloceanibacter sp. wino2 TaxID=2170729 RepID=UPI00131F354D|nr:mechanosensitive ion channel domain-containing protein [Methyloceanibacter sp. wino2]
MIRRFWHRAALFSTLFLLASGAWADTAKPLLAIDTSSPRATMQTFLDVTQALESAAIKLRSEPGPAAQAEAESLMRKALRTLDLSQVRPSARREIGGDAVVFLVDILRRIDLPPLDSIPDAADFPDGDTPASWTIPGTEITISRVMEGPSKGQFLFSPDTVTRAGEFYDLTKQLPLKMPSQVPNWREAQLQFHGWMIPPDLTRSLPRTLKQPVLDTPIWKIIAAIGIFAVLAVALLLLRQVTKPKPKARALGRYLRRLLLPVAMLIGIFGAEVLITEQVMVLGTFADMVDLFVEIAFYVAAAWVAWLFISILVEWVITSPQIPEKSLDANLLRLLGRVLGILAVASIAAYGAQQLGLPVLGVLAGLGVGGLAVALAAQNSLENLIGGLNLYADRPIRVGDFCDYAGIKGTVEYIGLRSTRIRGADRTVTSVPNSMLAKTQVTNYALRDHLLFRHVLDLRYETTTEQLRTVCNSIRELLSSHPNVSQSLAPPRAHVVCFGEWSIQVEVQAYLDVAPGKFLATQEELLLAIAEIIGETGTTFAFPSQTNYVVTETAGEDSSSPRA